MSKIKIDALPVWDTELSLGAKLLWICNFSRAEIERETVRGTLALLAKPDEYAAELSSAGWITRDGNSLRSVVPARA
jgi:hypothetical protein